MPFGDIGYVSRKGLGFTLATHTILTPGTAQNINFSTLAFIINEIFLTKHNGYRQTSSSDNGVCVWMKTTCNETACPENHLYGVH